MVVFWISFLVGRCNTFSATFWLGCFLVLRWGVIGCCGWRLLGDACDDVGWCFTGLRFVFGVDFRWFLVL